MPDNSTPKHHHNKMGTEPIGKLLLSMSLPAMFSMLIQALYNIVDSIYVAQIGEHALTAVSLAFPVQNLMIAVSVGTGVGLNSLIARRLGERREQEASAAATHGVLISLAESLLFLLFGLFFCRMFFSAFTSDSTWASITPPSSPSSPSAALSKSIWRKPFRQPEICSTRWSSS